MGRASLRRTRQRPVRYVEERPTRIPSRRPAARPIVHPHAPPPPPPRRPKPSLSSVPHPQKEQTPSVAKPVIHDTHRKSSSRFSLTDRRRTAGGSESSTRSYGSGSGPSYDNSPASSPIILQQPPTESPTQIGSSSSVFSRQGSQGPLHKKSRSHTLPTNSSSASVISKEYLDSKPLPNPLEQKEMEDTKQVSPEKIEDSARLPRKDPHPQTRQRSRFPSLLASVGLVISSSVPKR